MPTGNQVAGVLKTNQDAIKAFLVCRDNIDKARIVVAGTAPSVFGINLDIGGDEVRAQGSSLLDAAQAYVEGMLATTPANDSPPSQDTLNYVQTAIDTTASDLALLTDVQQQVGTSFQQDLQDLINLIAGLASDAAAAVAKVVPWYVWLGLAAALALLVYIASKR